MKTKTLVLVLIMVAMFVMTGGVQAAGPIYDTSGNYSLIAPDSGMDCTPEGFITSTGLPGKQIDYVFSYEYPLGTNNWLIFHTIFDGGYLTNYVIPYGNIPASSRVPNVSSMHMMVEMKLLEGGVHTDLIRYKWEITCTSGGNEGCTPGYWRNHSNAWPATGYSWSADFDTTFGVNFFNPNITLGQAIWLGGGGVNVIARHGTAALLSAAHPGVDYPYTVDEVITAVRLKDIDKLIAANELGCPLN